MNKTETFEQFLATQSIQVPVLSFVFNLLLAAVLSYFLGKLYIHYGRSLSNRKMFAQNFLLLTMITMLVISIVKSSLALSLGLVGALSIVRFRAAIKEPEELTYLFFAIGIGLGLGADQFVITLIAFTVISVVIIISKNRGSDYLQQNLFLTITTNTPQKDTLEQIVKQLNQHCSAVELKRFDESGQDFEATFSLELKDFKDLNTLKVVLQESDPNTKLTFLDNRGLIS